MSLRQDIESAINRHSAENGSNTPDFILADYLVSCLAAFDTATKRRGDWYGENGGVRFASEQRRPTTKGIKAPRSE